MMKIFQLDTVPKIFISVICILAVKSTLYGQEDSSLNVISIGYGVNSQFTTNYPFHHAGNTTQNDLFERYFSSFLADSADLHGLSPVFVKYEYRIRDRVSFGVNGSFNRLSGNYYTTTITTINGTTTVDRKVNEFIYTAYTVLFRINYHMKVNSKFDPYIGYGIGYSYENISFKPEANFFYVLPDALRNSTSAGQDLTIGMRYFITDHCGVYAETGIAKSIVQGGLCMQF